MAAAKAKRQLPKTVTKPEEPQPTRVILVVDGIQEELVVTGQKNGKIFVEKNVPKDEVTIILRGEEVVVDLLKLKAMDRTEQLYGVSVGSLLVIAELAKGE